MKLQDFVFPITNELSNPKTDKNLLAMAKEKGFHGGYTKYNKLFLTLFYKGGKVKFKPDLDPDFKGNAWKYCRSFMQSFEPKHEDKEAICAFIMSEILEPELES